MKAYVQPVHWSAFCGRCNATMGDLQFSQSEAQALIDEYGDLCSTCEELASMEGES